MELFEGTEEDCDRFIESIGFLNRNVNDCYDIALVSKNGNFRSWIEDLKKID